MIEGKNIFLSYTDKKGKKSNVLRNVSFIIPQGRITAFIGKSGAGKTSLLSCIAQLSNWYEGTILIDDKDIKNLSNKQRASLIGYVFQQFNLFPQLTVLQNCMQPLQVTLGLSKIEAEKIAREKLALLDMEAFSDKYPSQLSGGQQQRIAIARTLCFEPEALLLDEPTSALDPKNTTILVKILQKLAKKGIAIAMNSHDMAFVKQIIDRLYFMQDGNIVEAFDKESDATIQETTFIKAFLT